MGDLFGDKESQLFERSHLAKGAEDFQVEAQRLQLQGLRNLQPQSRTELEGIFGRADQQELAQRRTGLADLQQDIQGAQAARGLGSTSVGLGQLTSGRKALTEREAQLKSSIQDRVNALRQQQRQQFFQAATGAASSQNIPIRFQDQRINARGPGLIGPLLGAAGTAVGAFYGGPAGAAAGAGIGNAAGNAFGGKASATGAGQGQVQYTA